MESTIRDIGLAPQGQLKIDWVQAHMPVLNTLREEFEKTQPFQGKKVTICLHLEAKTAYLAKVVQAGGAEVTVAASNPFSTQDDVVAALVAGGGSLRGGLHRQGKGGKGGQSLRAAPRRGIAGQGGGLPRGLHGLAKRQRLLQNRHRQGAGGACLQVGQNLFGKGFALHQLPAAVKV